MSDTRKTDTLDFGLQNACKESAMYGFMVDHARQLERENNALRAALEEIQHLQQCWPYWSAQDLYEEACGISRNTILKTDHARHTEQT